MNCKVCGGQTTVAFTARVLGRHDAAWRQCAVCGFLQAQDPHWLAEAYRRPIAAGDIGLLHRNVTLLPRTACVIWELFDPQGRFLDYAGGYGILTRLLRDAGFDCYWEDAFTENLFARGFAYDPARGPLELVTCFEAFEHFAQPQVEVAKLVALAPNILFSTLLLPEPVPAPEAWSYYNFADGQHVSFYTVRSLTHLAERHGLRLVTNGKDLHLFTRKPITDRQFRRAMRHCADKLARIRRRFPSRLLSDQQQLRAGATA